MATFKSDGQPDLNTLASLLGISPNSVSIVQNPDGSWTVQVANDALPGGVIPDSVIAAIEPTVGDIDTTF